MGEKPRLWKMAAMALAGIMFMGGCTLGGGTKKDVLTESGIQYYQGLAESEENLSYANDEVLEYINIYIKYYGHSIPERELEYLRSMTYEECFKNKVLYDFYNTLMEQTGVETEEIWDRGWDDGEGFVGEMFEPGQLDDWESEEGFEAGEWGNEEDYPGSNLTLLDIMYAYRDNTYVARVGTPSGSIFLLYFDINEGDNKVVRIYGY